jgi:hypothetical protein
MTTKKKPCGIYRTTLAIGNSVPAGALVYFHNHGEPGPGVYSPASWKNNRATFHDRGTTVPDEQYAATLEPLAQEGFYRVTSHFYCCEARCQHFEEDLLVQLGYNGKAQAILFIPRFEAGAIALPSEGTLIDDNALAKIKPLKVPDSSKTADDRILH